MKHAPTQRARQAAAFGPRAGLPALAGALVLAGAALLTGCSGGSATPKAAASASASLDPQAAQVAYASCMTQHGVAVDPQQGVGLQSIQRQHGGSLDQNQYQQADNACHSLLRQAAGTSAGGDKSKSEELLKFTRCMRDHGVNVPDPQPNADGRDSIRIPPGPAATTAMKACQGTLPGVTGKSGGGSGGK